MSKLFNKLHTIQVICIIVMLACIAVLCFSLLTLPSAEPESVLSQNNSNYTPNDTLSQETRANAGGDIYTIREYNGIIGVFKNDEDKPYMTENVRVVSLPPDDKEIMEKGVTFNTYKEMIQFLQDYE